MSDVSQFVTNVTCGVKVPRMTHEMIHLFFGVPRSSPLFRGERDNKYDWVVPYFADRFEILFQFIGQTRIFNSWVDRSLAQFPGYNSWENFVRKVGSDVNGQVKNFLVACRTMSSLGPSTNAKILIRGSRSSSGSGTWIWMFADYLLTRHTSIQIDCYDITEVAACERREYTVGDSVRFATINRVPEFFEGDGYGYDVIVDDAYDPSLVTGTVPWIPNSPIFSLKDLTFGVEPYLHWTEGRCFSAPPPHSISSPCPCMVCRSISAFVSDFSEFQMIKGMTVLLGGSVCLTLDHPDILRAKGKVYRSLMLQPVVPLMKPSQVRAAIALSNSVHIEATSNVEIAFRGLTRDHPLRASRASGLEVSSAGEICDRLKDKHVIFVGVDPSVLGSTPTSVSGPPIYMSRSSSLIFFRHEAPPCIWVCDLTVYGYVATGYFFGYFNEFVKSQYDVLLSRSEYSVVQGTRVPPDISWTHNVPGLYHIDQSDVTQEMTMIGYCPIRTYMLNDPFFVTSRDSLRSSSAIKDFKHVIDKSTLRFGIFKFVSRGGVYFVEDPGPVCSYNPKSMVSVSCTHDHLVLAGTDWSYLPSGALQTVLINDRGPITVRVRSLKYHDLSEHFRDHRPGMYLIREKDQYLLHYNTG